MPINIDGTAVSSLTIDGTEVQEVTADGDVVFTLATNPDFSTAGKAMLAVSGGDVAEFELSTAWDVDTASHTGTTVSPSNVNFPSQGQWNNDGSKFYLIDDDLVEFNASTNYDVQTLTEVNRVTTNDSFTSAFIWNNDGTKHYTLGTNNDVIREFTVTNAFEVSPRNQVSTTALPDANGFAWNTNGTKLFIAKSTNEVVEYSLSTAFDSSTISQTDSVNFDDTNTTPYGIEWNPDGRRFYISDNNDGTIKQFDVLGTASDFTLSINTTPVGSVSSPIGGNAGVVFNDSPHY